MAVAAARSLLAGQKQVQKLDSQREMEWALKEGEKGQMAVGTQVSMPGAVAWLR